MGARKSRLCDILSEIENEIEPQKRGPYRVNVQNLHKEQDGKCAICGEPVTLGPQGSHEIDHRIPLARRGGNESENLQITHPSCNRKKGDSVDRYEQLDYLYDKHMYEC
jgi:5-methylcytosine-specific restriction endonuclease McrA